MQSITIISSYSKDTIIRNGVVSEVRLSGPAHYIEQAFRENAFPHTLVVGKQMQAEIEILPGRGERGRVCGEDFSQPLPKIFTPNVLISTLWKEWELSVLKEYKGRVFLDIQGFIRNPAGGIGAKKEWNEVRELADRIFCIKATELELNYLPCEVVVSQKAKCCLVITKGGEGSEIFYKGQRFIFTPLHISDLPNTLGAGDTYFANFAMSFINLGDIEKAGRQAAAKVAAFLQQKKGGAS